MPRTIPPYVRQKQASEDNTEEFNQVEKFLRAIPNLAQHLRDLAGKFTHTAGSNEALVTYLKSIAASAKHWSGVVKEKDLSDFLDDYGGQAEGWVDTLQEEEASLTKNYAAIAAGFQKMAGFYEKFLGEIGPVFADLTTAEDQARWLEEKAEAITEKFAHKPPTLAEVKVTVADMKETFEDYKRTYSPLISRLKKAQKVTDKFITAVDSVDFSAIYDLDSGLEDIVTETTEDGGPGFKECRGTLESFFDDEADHLKSFVGEFPHLSFNPNDFDTKEFLDGLKEVKTARKLRTSGSPSMELSVVARFLEQRG